jgi:hypothetical protein
MDGVGQQIVEDQVIAFNDTPSPFAELWLSLAQMGVLNE